jgi:assimilatory nitrate reductase catalytic subunit
MHWGSATLAGRDSAGINAVTAKAFCPVAKQPELKHAAIRVARADLPWRLVAFGVPQNPTAAIALREAVRERAGDFDYASVVLIGGERPGVLLRAAATAAVDPALLADVDALFELAGTDVARYDDRKRGIGRRIRVAAGKLAAVRLSGDVSGEAWLREWLTAERDVAALGSLLLLPSAQAPGGPALRGRIVCNCFDVAESEIAARLAILDGSPARALVALQAELKCGTNCGSCLPELKRMAAVRPLKPQRHAVAS